MTTEQEKIAALRGEITGQRKALERKNRELDALHFVWCSGGCDRGVHRYTKENLTGEIVAEAIRNTARLMAWKANFEYKARKGPPEKYQEWEAKCFGLAQKAAEARKAALEDAAKTKCLGCRRGRRLGWNSYGERIHYHPVDGGSIGLCHAAKIHDLIDSPAPEGKG